ncbi:hypothetical protein BD626DRAFT_171522 [Schizophyllum amplum]|uniref:Uncharacterized protein n=1 Tax=Schizophyllum amplum TaxID=97359 RepID=A0A550CR37_9AGAR|nr:hypothetical protein BD626DRAFT_171522 [Auriculariopsis ampla]
MASPSAHAPKKIIPGLSRSLCARASTCRSRSRLPWNITRSVRHLRHPWHHRHRREHARRRQGHVPGMRRRRRIHLAANRHSLRPTLNYAPLCLPRRIRSHTPVRHEAITVIVSGKERRSASVLSRVRAHPSRRLRVYGTLRMSVIGALIRMSVRPFAHPCWRPHMQ